MRTPFKIPPLRSAQISQSFTLVAVGAICLMFAVLPANSLAQERLFASPNFENGNRFAPSQFDDVELPVALGGFCPITLRDKHQWFPGRQQLLVVFDGQIYWFASERERAIFAASPTDYAPVLGGDCAVTLAETGERELGKLEFAVEHAGRLYMFTSEQRRQQFQSNPDAYTRSDLANDGFCLVSEVEEERQIAGMPETTVMVDGLRYMFAGDFQRRKFAADIRRYGVERHLKIRSPDAQQFSAQSESGFTSDAEPLDEAPAETEPEMTFVMDGYCPVTLQQRNIWVRGRSQYRFKYEGKIYLLAGDAEKNRFMISPEKFAPALGGDCVVSKIDDSLQVPGSVDYAVFHQQSSRMFLFAGPDQKAAFTENPERYIKLAKVSAYGTKQGDATTPAQSAAPDAEKSDRPAQ